MKKLLGLLFAIAMPMQIWCAAEPARAETKVNCEADQDSARSHQTKDSKENDERSAEISALRAHITKTISRINNDEWAILPHDEIVRRSNCGPIADLLVKLYTGKCISFKDLVTPTLERSPIDSLNPVNEFYGILTDFRAKNSAGYIQPVAQAFFDSKNLKHRLFYIFMRNGADDFHVFVATQKNNSFMILNSSYQAFTLEDWLAADKLELSPLLDQKTRDTLKQIFAIYNPTNDLSADDVEKFLSIYKAAQKPTIYYIQMFEIPDQIPFMSTTRLSLRIAFPSLYSSRSIPFALESKIRL